MAENRDQPKQATHRAYSVIRREGQDDFWLNLGLVFPHKDSGGFTTILQAFPSFDAHGKGENAQIMLKNPVS